MYTLNTAARFARDLISPFARVLFPIRWKEFNELHYWKRARKARELSNTHFRNFYTAHFGLSDSFYTAKTILDIGCGPRGSLEWATMAARRIGLDPLACEYLRLGADRHEMEYIDAPSERIPLDEGACDVVCSFNSLDHVENVALTIQEIKRVTRDGGLFLLLVEVNHAPTDCEPHRLSPRGLVDILKPELVCQTLRVYRPTAHGLYHSLRANELVAQPLDATDVCYMSAKFLRTKTA